jgi:hypothetical protein
MLDLESYCRDIEAYLCRKNDGHLIRIVGPAFEQVSRWAQQGVPLKVAYAGIDRYFERYYRKGPRRRPVRVEFCEADVLDAFDGWRRAVGVAIPIAGTGSAGESVASNSSPSRRRASMSAHVERLIGKLTALRASGAPQLSDILESTARDLDALKHEAKHARGEARAAVVAQLASLDGALLAAATAALDDEARAAGEAEVREALAPFRDRMAQTAYQQARAAAAQRFARDHFGLPTLTYDE